MEKKGYQFKPGEEVSHKDRLLLKMFVRRILYKTKELKPKNGDPDFEIEHVKKYIVGIECHWWDTSNAIQVNVFHSKELVPYHIAKSGEKTVLAWLNDR